MSNATAKQHKKKKSQFHFKDLFIGAILLVSLVLIVYSRFSGLAPEEWKNELLGVVGDFSIYLIGIIGVFEFCYDNGIHFLVPERFIDHKEESLRKQTKEYLHGFLDKESEFLKQHEESRLADALAMMGLSASGYQGVQAKALEARLAPMHSVETARSKMLDLIFYSDVVCDLQKNASHVNMLDLRYYFKFHDLMHNKRQNDTVAQAMATFISLTCEQQGIDLAEIDVIMVPHSSNYLLGLTVSNLLGKHFIKMIPPDKRVANFSYEGVIPEKYTKKVVDVLVLHDVLLTGRQIWESVDLLKATLPNCNIHGLFSAVYRNVKNAKGILEHSHGIPCYSLIELTEEQVGEELAKRDKGC